MAANEFELDNPVSNSGYTTTPLKNTGTTSAGSSTGTPSTDSESPKHSSDEHDLDLEHGLPRATFDIERAPHALGRDDDPLFVASRIIRHAELRLMSHLPTPDKAFQHTSIITPDGLYQLNQNTHAFVCILHPEQLTSVGLDAWLS